MFDEIGRQFDPAVADAFDRIDPNEPIDGVAESPTLADAA